MSDEASRKRVPFATKMLLKPRAPSNPVPLPSGDRAQAARLRWHEMVLGDHFLSPSAQTVAGYLMHRADARGQAFPAAETIAAELCLSLRTTQRGLDALRDLGWLISTRRGRGMTNLYQLAFDPDRARAIEMLREGRRSAREAARETSSMTDHGRMRIKARSSDDTSRTVTDDTCRSATHDAQTLEYESCKENPVPRRLPRNVLLARARLGGRKLI